MVLASIDTQDENNCRFPLDDPLPGLPSARPGEEGEQGTLKGALPDPILKVTMGGE